MLGPTSEAFVRITIDFGARVPGFGWLVPVVAALPPGTGCVRFFFRGFAITAELTFGFDVERIQLSNFSKKLFDVNARKCQEFEALRAGTARSSSLDNFIFKTSKNLERRKLSHFYPRTREYAGIQEAKTGSIAES